MVRKSYVLQKGRLMKKELESRFVTRQYMLAQDFEVYYYSDSGMAEVRTHSHDLNFIFSWKGTSV